MAYSEEEAGPQLGSSAKYFPIYFTNSTPSTDVVDIVEASSSNSCTRVGTVLREINSELFTRLWAEESRGQEWLTVAFT